MSYDVWLVLEHPGENQFEVQEMLGDFNLGVYAILYSVDGNDDRGGWGESDLPIYLKKVTELVSTKGFTSVELAKFAFHQGN